MGENGLRLIINFGCKRADHHNGQYLEFFVVYVKVVNRLEKFHGHVLPNMLLTVHKGIKEI
jgi:hypothetical protein